MRHLRTIWAAGSAIVALAALTSGPACGQDKPGFVVRDDRGVTVRLSAAPKRVAGISYLAADVSLALGIKPFATTYLTPGRAPDFLLGLTRDMVQLGQRAKPNLELLSKAKPDLVIAMRRYTAANAQHLEKIAPYVAYNMELFSESEKEVTELSRILGKPERGKELNATFRQHLQDYANKAPKAVHPRFLIMWAGATPFSFHDENTAASIAIGLGGVNIAGPMTQGGRFGTELSLESMLEKNPEVIFVYDSGPDRPHENNPIWKQLSAVKNKRVHYVGDHWVETNGPIAREIVLREAAHYLYPGTFPAVDVRAEAVKLIPAGLQK
ncbi:ABC transporter substrate-binding protein [Undibacterium oligocarboniphilum]|uniref:ABC transporter substrate-binding protein n=1 Tax=Undibacterium oligocarboniphilum TaxID=666702 RepID=A0A850QLW1_9BURK|nr:ABC transporter substrate-binding protein [Undibacterium oligocarboniphilum]MBC3869331.1 ABC transporter substrate-binding protein [Undibacterium oligocarboniphilum]NVO77710.1 ABC transporter substrate-binding protein [Undibacterium oligocarboniphilum]